MGPPGGARRGVYWTWIPIGKMRPPTRAYQDLIKQRRPSALPSLPKGW